MPMRPGDEFAGYPCLKVLHDDPSRQVYVVRHPRLPRRYTLTVFTIAVSSEHEFRDQFYRETAIASTLLPTHRRHSRPR
jgi:serine/threonine-protein kinase